MSKHILLIEDNLEMRENTAEILELASYQVTTAEHGKIGVKLAKEKEPDLIICDIMMPELDGYGVLFMLEKDPATAGIPFIFLTAKTEKSELRKGMELGADDYLTKPYEEMDLLKAVEGRLKKSEVIRRQKFEGTVEELDEFFLNAKGLSELEKLSEDRQTLTYKKKQIIFREGDTPNKLYFISKGKVKLYKMNDDGKELITGLFNHGEFFGFQALLEGNNYEEWATALEDTELCIIPKEDFLSLLFSNREVSRQFIKMLSNNLADKEDQLLKLAYDTVKKRIAEALLLLKEKYHDKESEEDFSINFSRDDLSKIAGTAKETTIRALSELKEEKLIDIRGRNIVLTDPEGLAKIEY